MSEVQSAVLDVKSPRTGRKPVIVDGGKSLTEARAAAQKGLADAKEAHKAAKAAHKAAEGNLKEAAKRDMSAIAAVAAATPAPVDRNAIKARLDKAKADARTTSADLRDAVKAHAANVKALEKAAAALAKAEHQKLGVEQARAAVMNPAAS